MKSPQQIAGLISENLRLRGINDALVKERDELRAKLKDAEEVVKAAMTDCNDHPHVGLTIFSRTRVALQHFFAEGRK